MMDFELIRAKNYPEEDIRRTKSNKHVTKTVTISQIDGRVACTTKNEDKCFVKTTRINL